MITGDVKETANSIALDIGIIEKNGVETRSLTGFEFERLTDNKKLETL
jgi:magnesium-transporting ATPase (P-type)